MDEGHQKAPNRDRIAKHVEDALAKGSCRRVMDSLDKIEVTCKLHSNALKCYHGRTTRRHAGHCGKRFSCDLLTIPNNTEKWQPLVPYLLSALDWRHPGRPFRTSVPQSPFQAAQSFAAWHRSF